MSILETIIEETKERITYRKKRIPQQLLCGSPYFSRPTLSLSQMLSKKKIGIIAECKKASPSRGVLRKHYDPPTIARSYEHAGAAGISVLTEEKYFLGSLKDLVTVRHGSQLPLLRKDFIVDPYQLYEAKAYGADVVLLIASALEQGRLTELLCIADELRMEALVEVHSRAELEKVPLSSVKLLGVNNRDLRTFTVKKETTVDIAREIPKEITLISESGIRTPEDIAYLYQYGVKNFLIGETFMCAQNPGEALHQLLSEGERLLC